MSYAWEKVEEIFHTALALPPEERKTFLQTECADDGELIAEVESLLHSFEHESAFLDEPVFDLGLGALGNKPEKNLSGTEIGVYHLLEKLGMGGMGEVYLAQDTRLNRRVALKFISESLENDRAAERRLVKEARAAAALEHPNVCAVHGIEESGEHHFIVMQYVEGKTLDKITENEKISIETFTSLARQILNAVAFAHSHSIIHRDLKPGNIMLTPDGQIKVLDFGLAKQSRVIEAEKREKGEIDFETSIASSFLLSSSHNTTLSGLIMGTVAYMSPEQLRGKKADFRSDIFSIGIILYELMTGKNPFTRQSKAEIIAAVLEEEAVPLRQLAPEFPEILRTLVEKCLEKDTEKRFQSAAEVLVELDNAESESHRLVSSKKRARSFLKAALAAVVLIAIFVAGYFFYNGKRPQRTFAVLPISVEQGLSEKEYLADGLTQSLIEKLSNLSDLKVKSESLITRYKNKSIELREAGKELNVDAVFVGTLKTRADGLFLESQIVRISDGVLIDRNEQRIEEANIVGMPENIVSRIIERIQTKLTDEDKNKLDKKDTESAEAKNLYMQGRFYLKRKSSDDVQKAIDSFFNAKEIDQKYARAWAGLADAYLSQAAAGVKNAVTPEQAVEPARLAAKKAMELDDTLSEPYNSLGLISLRYEWKWKEAEDYFRTSISRDVGFLPARMGLITVFQIQGRYDEALREAEKIKEIDPLSISSDMQIAQVYYRKYEFEQMDKILSDLLRKHPNNTGVKYARAYQYLKINKFNEATELMEPIYNSDSKESRILFGAPLGFAYAKMGRRAEASKIITELEKFKINGYIPAQEKALIYVGLGDYDKVFELLNESCKERFSSLPGWITDPIVEEVWSDPRFVAVKSCVNL